MDMKAQGSRSGKVLGIGELLASAPLDHEQSYESTRLEERQLIIKL